ncbi:hypothetical protein Desgi_3362 [Desulfoscipio gibsoniae DSM 7213]|uniref:Uncharacterized protein n=2 Tax=Desulfoscipio gibsoniae TaxID=102134 RepID=R4KMC3_9FIRM|nr:hypothetical protein Desgi_3362 [Desulfoscipio gibsoniae DSM 7213]
MFFTLLCMNTIKPTGALAMQSNSKTPESVIIFWTDEARLKAVNLTFSPNRDGPIGIISVPVYTWLADGQQATTVGEYYLKHGPVKLTQQMETLFENSISAYIIIDQKALVNVSKVIGPINMADQHITLMDVFEGKYVDGPVNMQVEIRQLADAMLTPAVLIKVPEIIWVFSREVDSNISPRHLASFYRVIRYRGSDVLQKKDVPGQDYVINNRKYRRVAPDTWQQTLREVTSSTEQ